MSTEVLILPALLLCIAVYFFVSMQAHARDKKRKKVRDF